MNQRMVFKINCVDALHHSQHINPSRALKTGAFFFFFYFYLKGVLKLECCLRSTLQLHNRRILRILVSLHFKNVMKFECNVQKTAV